MITDNFVNGKVNIFLTKDPTREEAIQIIQISLLMNGFSLVPEEPDIVKVIGTGKNPRTQGVPSISGQADIPPGDQVVSYLFRLRYADPAELQQVIGQYLSPPSSYTSVLPLPKSSSILITENSTVIRGLAKIIEQIDVAPAEVTSEFIKLERADASKVCDMLKDIFEKSTDQTQPGMPPGRGGVQVSRIVFAPRRRASASAPKTKGVRPPLSERQAEEPFDVLLSRKLVTCPTATRKTSAPLDVLR